MKNTVGVMAFWRIFVLGCVISMQSAAGVAGIGAWKNYTNMTNVRAVAAQQNILWAATSGGVFRFDPSDSTYQKFTNSEGLSSNDVTAIAVDKFQNIWIGSASGNIDIYSPTTGSWQYIKDIAVSTKTNKRISSFQMKGDSIYIATGFGISLFTLTKFEFRETYENFVSFLQPVVFQVHSVSGRLYAATEKGVFASLPSAVNLSAPDAWESVANISNPTIVEFRSTIYFGSDQGLLKYQGNSLSFVSNTLNSKALAVNDTALFFATPSELFTMNTSGTVLRIGSTPAYFQDAVAIGQKIFFAGQDKGIFAEPGTWRMFAPNGPAGNAFASVVIDQQGTIWAGSGRANGKGFYSYNGNQWRNYNSANSPLIQTNDCFAVSVGPNNSKWISTWGGGLILVNSAGDIVKRYDNTSPGFVGIPNDPSFVVPARIAVDRFNNVWTSVYLAANQSRVVWKMSPDSTWTPYPSDGASYNSMLKVTIDQYGTKWFTNRLPGFQAAAKGVYFNESAKIGTAVNGWGILAESDGLTSSGIYDVVNDKNGDLWIGTESGVTIITEPSNPQIRVSKVYLGAVRDQQINCIAVDPLNNKWIGTSRGVFVLSPDGGILIQHLNIVTTNGQLVDDNVFSIAFDTKKGVAYFGTEKGLSSWEIEAVQPVSAFDQLSIFPNPAIINGAVQVEIRGLVEDSIIKVLAVNGKLIKQFTAQGGGRAFWNCRDDEGAEVASGVYILVAHSRDGKQTVTGKIAVIKK